MLTTIFSKLLGRKSSGKPTANAGSNHSSSKLQQFSISDKLPESEQKYFQNINSLMALVEMDRESFKDHFYSSQSLVADELAKRIVEGMSKHFDRRFTIDAPEFRLKTRFAMGRVNVDHFAKPIMNDKGFGGMMVNIVDDPAEVIESGHFCQSDFRDIYGMMISDNYRTLFPDIFEFIVNAADAEDYAGDSLEKALKTQGTGIEKYISGASSLSTLSNKMRFLELVVSRDTVDKKLAKLAESVMNAGDRVASSKVGGVNISVGLSLVENRNERKPQLFLPSASNTFFMTIQALYQISEQVIEAHEPKKLQKLRDLMRENVVLWDDVVTPKKKVRMKTSVVKPVVLDVAKDVKSASNVTIESETAEVVAGVGDRGDRTENKVNFLQEELSRLEQVINLDDGDHVRLNKALLGKHFQQVLEVVAGTRSPESRGWEAHLERQQAVVKSSIDHIVNSNPLDPVVSRLSSSPLLTQAITASAQGLRDIYNVTVENNSNPNRLARELVKLLDPVVSQRNAMSKKFV